MAPTRTARSEAMRGIRRRALLEAALAVFSEKGVAGASVDDIVRAAGSAKGTFYLYFESKESIVGAVAELLVERVGDRFEAAASAPGRSAVERLQALGSAMREIGTDPAEVEVIEAFHRPENRALHDRMSEEIIGRLAPSIARVIGDGVASGEFRRQDPGRAAAYVLGAYAALHDAIVGPEDVAVATVELDTFVLRGLGYEGEVEA